MRFITPLFIAKFPLPATILSMILDVDALVAQKSQLTWRQYHRLDKILDYWFYIWILLFSLNKPIAPYMIAIFAFRSIGQYLSFKTYKTKYLIFFPQIIDLYLLAYLFSNYFVFLKPYFVGSNNWYVIAVLMVIGLLKEFSIHVFDLSLAGFLRVKSSWKPDKRGSTSGKVVKFW